MNFLEWLDRYVEVDKLNLRPAQMIPQLRWWEWAWYVAVVIASVLAFDWADDWLSAQLSTVPVLHYAPWLIKWPLLGVLSIPVTRYLMPAREARLRAPGEGWLVAGLWLAVWLVELALPGKG